MAPTLDQFMADAFPARPAYHPGFDPTDEQAHALDLFLTGKSTAIVARAGAGKTSTLRLMAGSVDAPGTYLAFNRVTVEDARKTMPRNLGATTAHSLAWRALGHRYRPRIDAPRMHSTVLADLLGVPPLTVPTPGGGAKRLAPAFLASHTLRAITRFCQSADPHPTATHFEYIEGIDQPENGLRTYASNNLVADALSPFLERAWADMGSETGTLPYGHDVYLKQWQLRDPKIPGEFIMFDEAQDAAPVMIAAVEAQEKAQLVFVGDPCQPPDARVLVVTDPGRGGRAATHEERPLAEVRAGDLVVSYSVGGGRFYPRGRRVDGVTWRPYNGPLVCVHTEDDVRSRYTPNHWCVVDPAGLADRWVMYLMRRGDQYRIGACRYRYASGCGPVARARSEHADAVWVLDVHASKRDALVAEASAAGRFGLPTVTFRPVNSRGVLDAEALARIWQGIGPNEERAARCAAEFGRDLTMPWWRKGEWGNGRRLARVRATNLLPGHRLVAATGERVEFIVRREHYAGPVISLDVRTDHTYVADGLVTSNCQQIYEWRGAVDALDHVPSEATAYLRQSFRFGPAIADEANVILSIVGPEALVAGTPSIPSRVERLSTAKAFLTRTNAAAVGYLLAEQAQGRHPHLVGGGLDVILWMRAASNLMAGRGTEHRDLACFDSWGAVREYVGDDPQGDELALLVKLADDYGPDEIIYAIERMPPESSADVVVSTAHKAKGREWPSVILGDDFPATTSAPELRLAYVALTRAQLLLDTSRCDTINELRDGSEPGALFG